MNPNCSASAAKKPATNSQTSLPACCPWKPSASVREACYKARLLFLHCSSRMGVSICSAHCSGLGRHCLKCFAFQLEQKHDLFSHLSEEKKNPLTLKEGKKMREVKGLQVPSLFIKKKSTAKTAEFPFPFLNNVEKNPKKSQDLCWKAWKNKQPKKPLWSISKRLFLALKYILWKAEKTGTCTIHHVRLSKHT